MRNLLLLPVTLPFRIAKGGLSLTAEVVSEAARRLSGSPPAPERPASPVTGRAAPSPARPAPAPPPRPPAPVTPLRPEPPESPPPGPPAPEPPPAAARNAGTTLDEPLPPPPAPPTPPEAIPPEPTPGQAAAEREARREAETTEDSPGAVIRVDEPWPEYRKQSAPDIVRRLNGSDAATKAVVRLYESQHRKRKSILTATGG